MTLYSDILQWAKNMTMLFMHVIMWSIPTVKLQMYISFI
jgi:hypothetical protein